jgi:hypothetical protein
MENITAFDPSVRDLDPERPLYPCSDVADVYAPPCWQMQTSVMREYGYNSMETAGLCFQAGDFIGDCFRSLGRDESLTVVSGGAARVAQICEEYAPDYEYTCIEGVTTSLIDYANTGQFAYEFCGELGEVHRNNCFRRQYHALGRSLIRCRLIRNTRNAD